MDANASSVDTEEKPIKGSAKLTKRRKLYFFVDIGLAAVFFLNFSTGLIKFPDLLESLRIDRTTLPMREISIIHDYSGLFLGMIILIHIFLHRKWILKTTKSLIKKPPKKLNRRTVKYALNVGLVITFTATVITGFIKQPSILSTFEVNQRELPMYEISLIHDYGALTMGFLILGHLILHLHWLKTTSIRFFQEADKRKTVVWSFAFVAIILFSLQAFRLEPVQESAEPIQKAIIEPIQEVFFPNYSENTVTIEDIGEFAYEPNEIVSLRPDIFKLGYFSAFDVLAYLNSTGKINMQYYFNESMNTYVIDSINRDQNWWYGAYYDGGWPESNAFRMDHYPYKDKMIIEIIKKDPLKIAEFYRVFKEEVDRKAQNGGIIIIPKVTIRGFKDTVEFTDVDVYANDLRNDMFQNGVITAIDVILALGARRFITYDLQWYPSIGAAEVKNWFIDGINDDDAGGRCGFVYEEGSNALKHYNHIHIPSDIRVLNSPDYELWFWICI